MRRLRPMVLATATATVFMLSSAVSAHADGPSDGDVDASSSVTSVEAVLDANFDELASGQKAVQRGGDLVVSDTAGEAVSIPIKGEGDIVFAQAKVAVSLDGQATKGGVSKGRIIQPKTHKSTDTVIIPQSPESVEVFYVLNDKSAPSQFRATLDLPAGARLTKSNDQLVVANDAAGNPLLFVSAPWAVDATGKRVDLRLDVKGKDQVVLTVKHAQRAAVVYPVLVDPYFDTVWNNIAEAWWCATNWLVPQCARAKTSADAALSYANQYFPGTVHNGKGDAFRHCYWSARMTIEDGVGAATKIATRHEDTATGQPAIERDMDLRNNALGRAVGVDKGRNTESYVRTTCKNRASAGYLWTIVNGRLV